MIRKYLLPILAILGALFALVVVYVTTRPTPVPPILFPPPKSPYEYSIAGAGIVEASSLNISVGSSLTNTITDLYVCEGDCVKKDDPLYKLDTRNFEAQKQAAQGALDQAKALLEDKRVQFSFYERLGNVSAVSESAFASDFYAVKEAEGALKQAEGNLQDIEVNLALSTVCAPVDGMILQVNVRPGEIVIRETPPLSPAFPFTAIQSPTILMGSITPLILRIDIDEDDAWRYCKGAKATAFVRGNSRINFPLEFVRIEPYIIPKISFTGDVRERVDTRVLQVLYSFEWGNLPVFPGQVLDIFIEAGPNT